MDEAARVLLITGDPGIGKTRLLEELMTRIQSVGGLVPAGLPFDQVWPVELLTPETESSPRSFPGV